MLASFCLPPPHYPLSAVFSAPGPPVYTSPILAHASVWLPRPSHIPTFSAAMLSPPCGKEQKGDGVAIKPSTPRVDPHSRARVTLIKYKSNHTHPL